MLAAVSGAVVALALSGGVSSPPGAGLASELTLAALAPAPKTVVLETRSFGTVTVDHAAHLARRASCKTCHGPGPIQHIDHFEPKVAHDRCLGCHKQESKGPTGCRDCHVVKPSSDTVAAKAPDLTDAEKKQRAEIVASAVAVAGSPPPPTPATSGPTASAAGASTPIAGAAAVAPGAASATAAAPTAGGDALASAFPHLPDADGSASRPFLRIVSLGFAVMDGPGQSMTTGPAVSFSTREDDVLLMYTLERGSAQGGSGRTLGLIGAGLTRQLFHSRWNAFGALLGGFDATEAPVGVVPTVALRLGTEWFARRTCFSLYGTAGTDLVRQTNKLGEQIGGFTFSVGASIGYVLGRD